MTTGSGSHAVQQVGFVRTVRIQQSTDITVAENGRFDGLHCSMLIVWPMSGLGRKRQGFFDTFFRGGINTQLRFSFPRAPLCYVAIKLGPSVSPETTYASDVRTDLTIQVVS